MILKGHDNCSLNNSFPITNTIQAAVIDATSRGTNRWILCKICGLGRILKSNIGITIKKPNLKPRTKPLVTRKNTDKPKQPTRVGRIEMIGKTLFFSGFSQVTHRSLSDPWLALPV